MTLAGPQPPVEETRPEAGGVAERLTEEQRRAVERREGPLLLSAAAGSGKTSVLVERFVRAVREDGVAPARILAITFTDRAAGELRERVRARFLELGEREAARDTEAAFVGTFHGFCARLLRAHPLQAGLDPDFTVLEEGLAGRLRARAFSLALRRLLARPSPEPAVDLLGAYGVDRLQGMIAGVHAQLRSRGQRLPRLPLEQLAPRDGEDSQLDGEALAALALIDELLGAFGEAYERLKLERGSVDFDDLELRAGELLQSRDGVRAAWSQRFELLMVDEFQDTNPRQLAMLGALEHENLFTVGDELQSIYGFRHADVGLFRARRERLAEDGRSLALTHNFRSRPPLLAVVNALFAERLQEFAPLRAARPPDAAGDAHGAAAGGTDAQPPVELLLSSRGAWQEHAELGEEIAAGLPPAPLWRQAEARLLAQRVAELVEQGLAHPGEVVVLLRALGDLELYERALQLAGLRTLAAVGGFWEHQQIGDLLSYLRALANPLDEEALYATLASPLVGISRDALALLALTAQARGGGAWETALCIEREGLLEELAPADRRALLGFCERLRDERAAASARSISALLERAIGASGYREHVLSLQWGERRLANVHKLLRLARRFEAAEGRDLRGFLDHVAHLLRTPGAGESDAPVEGVEPDAVRLMSIHAAKGLEFPVVCVADLGRAQNTRTPDLLVDGERVGLQLLRLDGARPTPTLDYEQLAQERAQAEAEEEDRILYVAMTRARERLLLSGAVDFERWPQQRRGGTAIAWLGPTLAAELPALCQAPEGPWQDLQVGGATVRCRLSAPATLGTVLRRELLHAGEREPTVPTAPAGEPAASPTQERLFTAPAPWQREQRVAALSYTSLSELERCGYRFYLERVLGMPEDRAAAAAHGEAGGLRARARGTLVHRLLEGLDFARPAAPPAATVTKLARELGLRLPEGEEERISRLVADAGTSALGARIAAAADVRREHPFAFALGQAEPLVTGVIDLLAREPDGLLVVDYKSDRVAPGIDLEAVVERDYGVQRLLYALAVLRDGAPSVEVVHWFLERPGEWFAARFDSSERGMLEGRLAERLARVRAGAFSVSARPHRGLCLTCPGRGSLCSWSESEALREDPEAPAGAVLERLGEA